MDLDISFRKASNLILKFQPWEVQNSGSTILMIHPPRKKCKPVWIGFSLCWFCFNFQLLEHSILLHSEQKGPLLANFFTLNILKHFRVNSWSCPSQPQVKSILFGPFLPEAWPTWWNCARSMKKLLAGIKPGWVLSGISNFSPSLTAAFLKKMLTTWFSIGQELMNQCMRVSSRQATSEEHPFELYFETQVISHHHMPTALIFCLNGFLINMLCSTKTSNSLQNYL